MARDRTRLVLLYGGQSAEHEVSCISAFHVLDAIDRSAYDVRVIGIGTDGRWTDTTAAAAALGPGADALASPDQVQRFDAQVLSPTQTVRSDSEEPLVVFPLLHGPMGEDGTVQGLLELAGAAYVGAGVAGSAAAMDKGLAKALLSVAGLPQARYLLLRDIEVDELTVKRVEAELGWPVFVKPANLGSSIGISRARDAAELAAALDLARRYDEYLIVEEAVAGRELEIGVLGWPELRTSVPGEIRPSRDFYDFEDKYLDGAARLDVPADVPAGVADEMAGMAIAACRALRVDCMARVDFFYDADGRGLVVNEINTIPGFTPISMYPRMWAASGVPYAALVDELVAQALRRRQRRARFETHRP